MPSTFRHPRLSLLVVTNRIGGLDLLFASLARQSWPHFELVLLDALYERRAELVTKKAGEYDLLVQHIACDLEGSQVLRDLNRGLKAARAPLVMTTRDYTHFEADAFERHMAVWLQLDHDYPWGVCSNITDYAVAPADIVEFPQPYGFVTQGMGPDHYSEHRRFADMGERERTWARQRWHQRYVEDFRAGSLDHLLWSTFRKPVTPDDDLMQWFRRGMLFERDHRYVEESAHPGYLVSPEYVWWGADSVPRKYLVAAGGFNERLDGGWIYGDSELTGRLHTKFGMEWAFFKDIRVHHFKLHGYLHPRLLSRTEEDQLALFCELRDAGFPAPTHNSVVF